MHANEEPQERSEAELEAASGHETEASAEAAPALRLVVAVGLNPGKWARIWSERYPGEPVVVSPAADADVVAAVRSRAADLALVREPFDREGLHAIELFAETPVVVLPHEHAFADEAALSVADLADEQLLLEPRVLGWRERAADAGIEPEAVWLADDEAAAIGMVPSTEGVVVTPMSVARLLDRKDVRHVAIADLPRIPVFLVWSRELAEPGGAASEEPATGSSVDGSEGVAVAEPVDVETGADALEERIQRFVGVVRGRRAASSRDGVEPGGEARPSADDRPSGRSASRSKRAAPQAGSRTKSGTSRGAQLRAKQAADEAKARAKREERAAKRRKRR